MSTVMQKLISHGYGIYKIPAGIAIADPEDGPDGVYLELNSVDEIETSGADFWVSE